MILLIYAIAITIAAVSFCLSTYRFAIRLLQLDELFELLQDDIEINIKFFKQLDETPLLSNASEVVEAHQNMQIMGQRLVEFQHRIKESRTGILSFKEKIQKQPRPVVA